MTNQELQSEISEMWESLRETGNMVTDLPANKVGMPYAAPYEGVCIPVEIDGGFTVISIPVDRVASFAQALIEMIPRSIAMDRRLDAEIGAHDAIEKAKGV